MPRTTHDALDARERTDPYPAKQVSGVLLPSPGDARLHDGFRFSPMEEMTSSALSSSADLNEYLTDEEVDVRLREDNVSNNRQTEY